MKFKRYRINGISACQAPVLAVLYISRRHMNRKEMCLLLVLLHEVLLNIPGYAQLKIRRYSETVDKSS